MKITARTISPTTIKLGEIHPVLQRIYQARGIADPSALQRELNDLTSYQTMRGIEQAIDVVFQALKAQHHIMIIGDYDADGATSTALAMRVLRCFGAENISYLVPNRFDYGYGLSPEIVAVAAEQQPDLLITVDNGIASIAGVEAAKKLGIKVLITDHHLAPAQLPDADAIVNPNQPGCEFASKALAGVGVCFYVMLALRRKLQQENWFEQNNLPQPNMADFLDLVALGTVADVVPLDHNNRILVHQGLVRIRAGHCVPGIKALLQIANRTLSEVTAKDLGFAVGPRLNAAGRLDDMSLGIECLLTDDQKYAENLAQQLNQLNLDRRSIEADMQQQALEHLSRLQLDKQNLPYGLSLYQAEWHQGVIGILAGRIKEQYHRPVIVFANADSEELKGSARSIPDIHIRDVLDTIATQYPGLIVKFGGHAMAAGLSIKRQNLEKFMQCFDQEIKKHLCADDLMGEIVTDGELNVTDLNLTFAELLQQAGPWGQAFPEPIFHGEFDIIEQRIVGQNHLRLRLQPVGGDKVYTGIKFNVDLKHWPNHRCQRLTLAYKLDINEFNGVRSVQLLIEHLQSSV